MKIRYCTFENVDGYLQQRQGGGWEVRSNWFEQMSNSAPLKCFDDYEAGDLSGAGRALVIGNRLVNQDIWIGAGNENGAEPPTGPAGLPSPGPYHRSREGQYVGNIARTIFVGEVWGAEVFPALDNNYFNNTATRTNVLQSGTTTTNPSLSFVQAVKLTAADVGMEADDPLCPLA
jgi:hypothetical protein